MWEQMDDVNRSLFDDNRDHSSIPVHIFICVNIHWKAARRQSGVNATSDRFMYRNARMILTNK